MESRTTSTISIGDKNGSLSRDILCERSYKSVSVLVWAPGKRAYVWVPGKRAYVWAPGKRAYVWAPGKRGETITDQPHKANPIKPAHELTYLC